MQFKSLLALVPLAAALCATAAPAGDHKEQSSTLTVTDFVPTDIGLSAGVASTASANSSNSSATTSSASATDLAKRQVDEPPLTLTVTDFVPTNIGLSAGVASTSVPTSDNGTATITTSTDVPSDTSIAVETDLAKRQLGSGIPNLPTGILGSATGERSSILGEETSVIESAVASATSALENATETDLAKREADYSNARLTWYDIATGNQVACGGYYQASDYVVALNAQQFGSGYPGPNCGRSIKITANGKTATAKIVDRCPGCPSSGLDLTKGLFTHFANPDVGVLTGSWSFA